MSCKDCFHYEACKGTYSEVRKNPLYEFDGEMYADSGCENFLEKNLVIKSPYKVGDKVYQLYFGGIREETITDITIVLDRYDPPYLKFDTQTKINGGIYSSFFNGDLIDKKVFSNKAEAERARNNEL